MIKTIKKKKCKYFWKKKYIEGQNDSISKEYKIWQYAVMYCIACHLICSTGNIYRYACTLIDIWYIMHIYVKREVNISEEYIHFVVCFILSNKFVHVDV